MRCEVITEANLEGGTSKAAGIEHEEKFRTGSSQTKVVWQLRKKYHGSAARRARWTEAELDRLAYHSSKFHNQRRTIAYLMRQNPGESAKYHENPVGISKGIHDQKLPKEGNKNPEPIGIDDDKRKLDSWLRKRALRKRRKKMLTETIERTARSYWERVTPILPIINLKSPIPEGGFGDSGEKSLALENDTNWHSAVKYSGSSILHSAIAKNPRDAKDDQQFKASSEPEIGHKEHLELPEPQVTDEEPLVMTKRSQANLPLVPQQELDTLTTIREAQTAVISTNSLFERLPSPEKGEESAMEVTGLYDIKTDKAK